jgi:hypothetical protein
MRLQMLCDERPIRNYGAENLLDRPCLRRLTLACRPMEPRLPPAQSGSTKSSATARLRVSEMAIASGSLGQGEEPEASDDEPGDGCILTTAEMP